MYESLTVESIKKDILSRMSTEINTSEGSYTNDMISAVAYEIWKYYQALDAIVPIAYVDETSGEYIDKRCAEYGISRKSGTKATAVLTIAGTDGTVIPKGKVFLTADGLQFEVDEDVTIVSGTASVPVTAAEIGDTYNVDAGTITAQFVNLAGIGINSVTNEAAAAGGADAETDSALVARLYDYLQSTPVSGNSAHYRAWALSVEGVGDAKVTALWDGPGTVKVLIGSTEKEPVDNAIVSACADYIEANRPIGAAVTVLSAEGLPVNISAAVAIDGTTTKDTVQAAFAAALKTYLQGLAFHSYTLLYNRIVYMLLSISGVTDYSSLTVNGGTTNLTIGSDQVPVIGTVTIT